MSRGGGGQQLQSPERMAKEEERRSRRGHVPRESAAGNGGRGGGEKLRSPSYQKYPQATENPAKAGIFHALQKLTKADSIKTWTTKVDHKEKN